MWMVCVVVTCRLLGDCQRVTLVSHSICLVIWKMWLTIIYVKTKRLKIVVKYKSRRSCGNGVNTFQSKSNKILFSLIPDLCNWHSSG